MGKAWVVLVVIALGACGGSEATSTPSTSDPSTTIAVPATSPTPQTTEAEVALPSVESVLDVADVVAIDSTPYPDWVTLAGDSAWVANAEDGVGRYGRATGELVGSVPTGTNICLAMDTAFDSLWLGDCATKTLVRVNLATGAIEATIALPFNSITEESSVAAGPDGVFVLGEGSTIARINPEDNTVITTFDAPAKPSALRASDGALWVTSAGTRTLSRIDPTSGEVLATVDVGPGARFLAIDETSVWVMNSGDGTVSRVDPSTNSVVATIKVTESPVQGGDMAVGGGFAWARVSAELVAQIDPSTNSVVARYGPSAGSGSVAADDDAVWISAHDVTTVWRVPIG
jgi:virginiamycin B lyase